MRSTGQLGEHEACRAPHRPYLLRRFVLAPPHDPLQCIAKFKLAACDSRCLLASAQRSRRRQKTELDPVSSRSQFSFYAIDVASLAPIWETEKGERDPPTFAKKRFWRVRRLVGGLLIRRQTNSARRSLRGIAVERRTPAIMDR